MVGPAPFYSRSNLPLVLLPSSLGNVIYNFNFFVPRPYVQQLDPALRYPGFMQCCDVFDKEHRKCCPDARDGQDLSKLPCCAERLLVNKRTMEQQLIDPIQFGHSNGVPVVLDQWGVQRGASGRLDYLHDMLSLLETHEVHWIYWQWRHRTDRPFAVVHMDDGSFKEPRVDVPFVSAFASAIASSSSSEKSSELRAYEDAICYAQRYSDLRRDYCDATDPHACRVLGLRKHFREHGEREGRRFVCDAPPSPPSTPPPPPPPPSLPPPIPPQRSPMPFPPPLSVAYSPPPSLPEPSLRAAPPTSSLTSHSAGLPTIGGNTPSETLAVSHSVPSMVIPRQGWYLGMAGFVILFVLVMAAEWVGRLFREAEHGLMGVDEEEDEQESITTSKKSFGRKKGGAEQRRVGDRASGTRKVFATKAKSMRRSESGYGPSYERVAV